MPEHRKLFSLTVTVLTGLALAFLLAAGLPALIYSLRASSLFQDNRSLWLEKGSSSYDMVVYSNSPTQPTGGRNALQVRDGMVVKADNPNCPNCSLNEFGLLTVEALFERVDTECIRGFPFQYCNVAYDPTLGYPRRIDTYPYDLGGRERPSITVESVIPAAAK